jgi:hypothetical protein
MLAVLADRTHAHQERKLDERINRNAQQMVDEGRQIFRFDTFGDEAFWGDTLKLHQAPLKGLFSHTKGGFYHDGCFATLGDVVHHYNNHFKS